MNHPARTLTTLSARRAARGIASPDAMAAYLNTLLTEAGASLADCVRRAPLGAEAASAIRSLEDAVRALRADLRWLSRDAPLGEPGSGALPSITRAMLRDVERAALCGAFRERCAGLASRLADPDATRAALAELRTGLTVLGRALGVAPVRLSDP